ncbi:phosphatidylserine decarboxylase proenzyme, mitochondrial-like isoform X1 [Varroa jacobsoni]|uniref:Phosphatidylserine decarboxylase proenzyme, mitochondrial n=1 Tax=Varroa destructor TaxID=109461 RepID=A0A7M7MDK6_VARDE|nr:phosphatidylserine decarboxylase proenzyme, mitochondrial-like isoform X2 [Varroa destructor]XP_022711781.1 phosphatidylserine decarboxylase proenzyme, mitochondrial-like isoform X1 [Varroa jacobsoni]
MDQLLSRSIRTGSSIRIGRVLLGARWPWGSFLAENSGGNGGFSSLQNLGTSPNRSTGISSSLGASSQPLVGTACSRGFALKPIAAGHKRAFGPERWWSNGRWALIAGAVGAVGVLATRAAFKDTSETPASWELNELKTSIYKLMPLRLSSKCWGVINNISLPSPFRAPVISAFSWYTGCNISEAAVDDPRMYPNLGEFFRRTLKPGLRPIAPGDCVVSPADGKILHFGEVQAGFVEQVKGIAYPLQAFLGPHPWGDEGADDVTDEHLYHEQMLKHKDGSTALYHCVVYLAPGDYHRFHSPADWKVLRRRHFPGKLLSVKPRVASWVKGLFNINERVVYSGEWKYGFFSMTAVGATNVGSIKCSFDPTLATNKLLYKKNTWCDMSFDKPIELKKGDDFGEFNMGSTVVTIFEAPKNFEWSLYERQKIKYGERIAGVKTQPVG